MGKKISGVLIASMLFAIAFANIVYGNEHNDLSGEIHEIDISSHLYQQDVQIEITNHEDNSNLEYPPLPRWREKGTPYDPTQSQYPYGINCPATRDSPLSGLIESPPEYAPAQGVLFWYSSSSWPTVVRDLVVSLTQGDQYDEIAYVVVTSASQQSQATTQFTSAGANMSKVKFIIEPGNAIWIRDYGPHFIWQDGNLALVDSHYYPTRPLDNFIPTLLGDDHFIMPTYDMGLYYSGGNFQPGQNRTGFVTSLINTDNPPSEGFNNTFIAQLYSKYQGIDTLHIMPQLPPTVDGTGHIDMWMYIIDEDSVIISEFKPGSNAQAIAITNNAVPYMQNLGYTVHRTPAWNANHPSNGYATHWTYTNAFRVNNRIFVPTFGNNYPDYADEDAAALAVFETAAGPDVEIVPIDSFGIIWASGALHCIVMQIPCYIEPEPTVHVIAPNGGELLVAGATEMISWVATDTNNVNISQINLYYSSDGGTSYEFITTTSDTGSYGWTVPGDLLTEQGLIKVVAISGDTDQAEDVSDTNFKIVPAQQTLYDFSTGAGINKFCFGYQTSSWSSINKNPMPVTTDVSSLVTGAYSKIASSDATGGDSDSNRYISPNPTNSYESTHVFKFTINENPELIDDIRILWEGYGDQCAQVELYIWDLSEEQWCNGQEVYGQNNFMDNWAGNRDGYLDCSIRSNNFSRYIGSSGQMLLLVYAERGPDGYYVTYNPTFHDYISVVVSEITGIPEISNVEATPLIQDIGGFINITCNAIAAEGVDTINTIIMYPDNSTVNETMMLIPGTMEYYYNSSYTLPGNYTFYVWVRDLEGNINASSQYWFNVENPLYTFNFFSGWNLVTVPVETEWTAETFGGNISGCSVVLMFNATTQTFLTHVVGTPWDDFPILDGVGYFLYVTTDSTLVISGFSIPSVTVPISPGWNIIGWYHDYTTTAESLGDNITGTSVILMFDAPTQAFLTHVVGTPWDNFTIQRGMGLFIYTTETSYWHGQG